MPEQPVSTAAPRTSAAWQRWYAALPVLLLVVATVIAVATERAQGHGPARTAWLGGLVAVTAAVVVAQVVLGEARPGLAHTSPRRRVLYVVRTALAFAMSWLNPFMAIFAFVGYLDAFDVFRRRPALLAMLATAITMAGSQSGGLPPRSPPQWVVFGVLVVFNAVLASAFTFFHESVEQTSQERAETITELERVNAELQQALAENAALAETVLAQAREAGVQEERQRLAREIHDTLAQDLAAVVTQLQALRDAPDPDGARLEVAHRAARAALVEARRSVQDLAPAPLQGASLATALGALLRRWSDEHDVQGDLVVTGEASALHPEVEATLVRTVQESLANVAKHAAATRVGVTLSYEADEVLLDVRDDGAGFDPSQDPGPTSFGLRGMRQRTERVAGVLEVESEPGRGTALSLRLPAVPAGSAA